VFELGKTKLKRNQNRNRNVPDDKSNEQMVATTPGTQFQTLSALLTCLTTLPKGPPCRRERAVGIWVGKGEERGLSNSQDECQVLWKTPRPPTTLSALQMRHKRDRLRTSKSVFRLPCIYTLWVIGIARKLEGHNILLHFCIFVDISSSNTVDVI